MLPRAHGFPHNAHHSHSHRARTKEELPHTKISRIEVARHKKKHFEFFPHHTRSRCVCRPSSGNLLYSRLLVAEPQSQSNKDGDALLGF